MSMPVPPLHPVTGLLPLGRHHCTSSDIERAFVADASFSASTTRRAIWDDWQQAVALLESTVTVHAAWLGGSFTSAVIDPADIDVTFIVNGDDFRSRTPAE